MKKTIALIFGGVSPEHEVSLASAISVLDHLDPAKFSTLLMGINKDGDWLVGPGSWSELYQQADQSLVPAGLAKSIPVGATPSGTFTSYPRLPPLSAFKGADLLFPVVHGSNCEDGLLQGVCQITDIPLVGCDLLASAICFDKEITKAILSSVGLPVTRSVSFSRKQIDRDPEGVYQNILSFFEHFNLFTKPVRSGSSLGISRVKKPEDLPSAFENAFKFDDRVLIEEYVDHRELVVGVLGNDDLVISPPGECVPTQELYSYEDKYIIGNPHFCCPARVSAEIADRVRGFAKQAYRALRCSVFARVDCFLDHKSDSLIVNEVNTIPGLTSASVYPKVMREAGYSYSQLLEELICLSLDKDADS